MTDPMFVNVTRGALTESRHSVHVAVVDAAGRAVRRAGDIDRPVFARSAVKVLQAIPLIETGAADAMGLVPRELALACASHSGEEGHRALAAQMLGKAGLGEAALECGCHWPFDLKIALAEARAGREPTPLGNNCSGKHAGFLCTAVHEHEATSGYVEPEHPVQQRTLAVMEGLTGTRLTAQDRGTDGCSIPTYAAPLEAWALAFARIAAGQGASADRLAAGRSLVEACMMHPWETSGTGRACLALMDAAPGRIYAKTGAEGVYCGAVPELGLGFALKVEDGATRAAECAAATVLDDLFRPIDEEVADRLAAIGRTPIRSWSGRPAGEVRPAGGTP